MLTFLLKRPGWLALGPSLATQKLRLLVFSLEMIEIFKSSKYDKSQTVSARELKC
jgi:hypothetical protein